MVPLIVLASLVAITPVGASPAPSASPAPVLQEIAHVRASACTTLVYHANTMIDAAMQNDVVLMQTVRALKSSHLNGKQADRIASLRALDQLDKSIFQNSAAGNKEVKELRSIAASTTDPEKKQAILDFANALGGALYRQYKIALDLNEFLTNVESRDSSYDPFRSPSLDGAPFPPPDITVNGQPISSNGYGSQQTGIGPMGVQRLLPTDDDAMAGSMADAIIPELRDVGTDESTAAAHADGATSGC